MLCGRFLRIALRLLLLDVLGELAECLRDKGRVSMEPITGNMSRTFSPFRLSAGVGL